MNDDAVGVLDDARVAGISIDRRRAPSAESAMSAEYPCDSNNRSRNVPGASHDSSIQFSTPPRKKSWSTTVPGNRSSRSNIH